MIVEKSIDCEPCRRKRSELMAKLNMRRNEVKKLARGQQITYAIWYDNEDKKIYSAPINEARNRGATDFEIISKY